jgi:hypothetical protein
MRLVPVPAAASRRRAAPSFVAARGAFHDGLTTRAVCRPDFRHLEQQLVVYLQACGRAVFAEGSGIRAMARAMMSAAEPCQGALMVPFGASAAGRVGIADPRMKHLRPKIVST